MENAIARVSTFFMWSAMYPNNLHVLWCSRFNSANHPSKCHILPTVQYVSSKISPQKNHWLCKIMFKFVDAHALLHSPVSYPPEVVHILPKLMCCAAHFAYTGIPY